ncbi:flagellar protein FlaG [Marinobacterium marinum]|uniref:Flagellar protein FlaG n=1 Tax=Marinobacterium marinum TaxID=2756129 RepID=A0A7W1WVS8_9GAMM|nr:flagellar protein FlaG [Marinobacterium marinum]MBA4500916.1 flagellar protein FlaG [Marinobacterium marinum]
MSTISPVTGQSPSLQGSSTTKPGEGISQAAAIPAKSSNSSSTDVANENAQLTIEEIEQTVASLNETMTLLERGINFEVDSDVERTIIKVVDRATDEVIKQIPSEDLLKVIGHLQEMQHLLFDTQA